jgi:hypothetical protein
MISLCEKKDPELRTIQYDGTNAQYSAEPFH